MQRILLSIALFILATTARASFLSNGSFELPAIPTNTGSTITPTGWNQYSGLTSLINGVADLGYPTAQDGLQYIGLGVEASGARDAISQSFTIASASSYVLHWFDVTPLGYGETSPYSVSVLDAADQTIASMNLDAYNGTLVWMPHSMPLALESGNYTLLLRAEGPIGHVGSTIDNVTLTAVPLPAAVWLFLSGIGLLSLLSRKRLA